MVTLKNENLPSASLHQLENSTSLCEVLPFCLSICCKHLSYLLLLWHLCVFFGFIRFILFLFFTFHGQILYFMRFIRGNLIYIVIPFILWYMRW